MNPGIIFAIITAIIFGLWTVFHNQAAPYINYLFGAVIISLTATVTGLILMIPKIKTMNFYTNPKGILFAVLVGICALTVDIFALKAYGSGLPISVGGPIIISGSVAVAALIGFFLGETITTMKILGILLVIIGSGILSIFSA